MQRWQGLAQRINWYRAAPLMLLVLVAVSIAPPINSTARVVGTAATTTSTSQPVTTTPVAIPTSPPTQSATSTVAVETTTPSTTELAPETPVVAPVAPPSEPPPDVARSIPAATPAAPPPAAPAPPWAASITTTSAGYISTGVGCASGTGAGALDAFFAARVGPMMGADYQHVVALGGNRYAWFFQDAFLDPSGAATRLDQSFFAHNLLLIQDGKCFTMLHRGTAAKPTSFEPGNGESPLSKWFWPMGAETSGGRVKMFWAEMSKDGYEPGPGDGLGWHPARLWLATYDSSTMKRLSFDPAPNSGVNPMYGYAVASDGNYTYLFGNTFEQNLVREGGFWSGQHSATAMYLARVPLGQLNASPEYRTADSWSPNAADARPFVQRYWAENPMQPRFIDGQWVAATKVDGYWGEQLVVEVANRPWGPWTTTEFRGLSPRGGDGRMNTYHAQLLPYRTSGGSLIVTVSQNARRMTADAFPHPERYRLAVFTSGWSNPPADPPPTTTTTTSTTTTTIPASTTTSSSIPTTSTSISSTTQTSTTTTTTTDSTTTTTATTTTSTTTTSTTTTPTTSTSPTTTSE
ncbi:MAG TPA: hypothetical protein PK020_11655 [Ilumatobacteraceae bacterium]|nr:hypothetical protein [Ilumatobacteraceae bacterium]HRB03904.1 hypothetical protein [Ilumatobacteraceae bacterium]